MFYSAFVATLGVIVALLSLLIPFAIVMAVIDGLRERAKDRELRVGVQDALLHLNDAESLLGYAYARSDSQATFRALDQTRRAIARLQCIPYGTHSTVLEGQNGFSCSATGEDHAPH